MIGFGMKIQVKFETGDLDLLFKVTGSHFVFDRFEFLTKVMYGFLSNSVSKSVGLGKRQWGGITSHGVISKSLSIVCSNHIPGFAQFFFLDF